MNTGTTRFLATLGGLLLALALVGGVRAGGWSIVVLDSEDALVGVNSPLAADTPVMIGFTVLQHGQTPMNDLAPRIIATNQATGAIEQVVATAEGGPGHYVATLRLPEAGVWSWQIDAFGPIATMAPLTVAAPAPAPAPAAPALVPWLALLIVLAGGLALVVTRRRRLAEAS